MFQKVEFDLSDRGKQKKRQKYYYETFPVPYSFEEEEEQITSINSNTFTEASQEKILDQAIKSHLQGHLIT